MLNLDAIQKAIAAHTGWKARLRTAVTSGTFEVAVATVRADNQCEFGKWLYGSELSDSDKAADHYQTVKQLHARFHQEAAAVVSLATSGQKDKAEAAIAMDGCYSKASRSLTEAMIRWRESIH
jgi:chemoreceptor zinc-binding protein